MPLCASTDRFRPGLVAADFVPTQWESAEQKAKFANALLRFIAADFPRSKFHEGFYRRLSNTFGHIAHYNRDQFYDHFFLSAEDKLAFLEQCVTWPCYGDPTFTYSDVERAIGARLRKSQVLAILSSQIAVEHRRRELALLAELKARYEPAAEAPASAGILDLFG